MLYNKNISVLLAFMAGACLLGGCSSFHNSVTQSSPSLFMRTSATFDILGPVEATSKGAYLFRTIGIGIENKAGSIGTGPVPAFYTPVQKVAVYNAIESIPGADAIIAPRWEITRSNKFLWFYCEEKATLKAKAIRFNVSQ